VSYTTVFGSLGPPFPNPVRKVGAPLAAIIALGTLAALILTLLTAADPGGAALGFALATVAMAGVLACYLWLDRWEPEPPRLLIMAFLWGASVAVVLSVALVYPVALAFDGGADAGVVVAEERLGGAEAVDVDLGEVHGRPPSPVCSADRRSPGLALSPS
jgi:multisubunit Na+/H+ antiporter MnhB subunit